MRLCADIGGSFIDIGLIDDRGVILDRWKHSTPVHDWPAFVATFKTVLAGRIDGLADDSPVCIAVAGLVDPDTGAITSANIPCIHTRPLAADLGAALGRPVTVINDADAFVLAEAGLGTGRGHARVFGVILGTGVGGGIVEDGTIVTGAYGIEGEWGHGELLVDSPIAPGSVPVFACGCGRSGCLDTVGSARGLERLHVFLHGVRTTSLDITRDWQANDDAATATVEYFVRLVAGPIGMILNTYPATIVPVGGGLSNCAPLIARIDEQVRRGMLVRPDRPVVVPSALGDQAGLLGAALASGFAIGAT